MAFLTRQQTGQVISAVVFACLAYGLIWELPRWQVAQSSGQMNAKEKIDAENSARTTWIQMTAGIFAAFTAVTTWQKYQADQEKHQRDAEHAERNFQALLDKQTKDAEQAEKNFQAIQEKNTADRFSKAVEMLGNEKLDIRLGGIFALEQIANTEDKYYWQIMEILTAYVRNRSPWDKEKENGKENIHPPQEIPELATDIQSILTVISRRRKSYGNGERDCQIFCVRAGI